MREIWIFFKEKNRALVKLVVLFSIAILYFERALNVITPYSTGDGREYILTAEALYNNLTPDVRYEDAVSFKKAYCENENY